MEMHISFNKKDSRVLFISQQNNPYLL